MARSMGSTLAAWAVTLGCVLSASEASGSVVKPIAVYASRGAESDLEITGLPTRTTRYVRLADLERLPGVTKNLQGDPDLGGVPMRVTGVYLETLASALGAYPTSDLIDILCSDRYRSHFPKEYVAEHHPMLVWKVDGLTPKDWAAKTHHYNAGPYFVTYADFVPSFHVLSHEDMPQMPTNIVRINFSTEAMTFGPITPTGAHAGDAGVQAGFAIAKQNCLRCHYRGAVGGTKSGRDWTALSVWAREQPAYFSKYVLNPRSIEPHSHMAPNPGYSEATRMALVQYFRTFTETAGTKR